MGVDFRIDDEPRYVLAGSLTRWIGEPRIFDDETIDADELRYLFEDPPEQVDVKVVSRPQQPPLPDDLPEHPSWAYSGFMRFRQRVAMTIGIDLRNMWGFQPTVLEIAEKRRGSKVMAGQIPNWESFEREQIAWWEAQAGRWEDVDNPLVPFLHHSDCDGDLSPEQCATVAPALREAVENLAPLREWATAQDIDHDMPVVQNPAYQDHDRTGGLQLVQMMEICAEYGRRLVFS